MRVVYALAALFAAVLIVYLDRDGYRDVEHRTQQPLSFLDCLYYATVSLSTTGYGDITPVTPSARLINVLVITPLRVAFLIVLIGTTVETLTTQSRQALKIQRWRNRRAQPHHRRRIRHQGQDGGRRDGRRRRRARGDRRRRREPGRAGAGQERGPGHRPRQRHRLRRAAAGQRPARQGDHRRHQPRRHRRAGHADRARTRAERQDHRRGPGSREPASAASSPAPTPPW